MQRPAPSRQRADPDGQGNVTVQIVGENNRVTVAGAASLRLTMFPRRRREGGEMGLLSPYIQSIDLVGRKPEMAEVPAPTPEQKPDDRRCFCCGKPNWGWRSRSRRRFTPSAIAGCS